MANDTNKPPVDPQKPASDAEKKHQSLLDQATALLKNPDILAGITDLTGLITGKEPSEAETILNDLKVKDDERLKKIADLQAQIKANETKITANNELLQKSRDAVTKLADERKSLDARLQKIDGELAALTGEIKVADDNVAKDDEKIKALKDKNKKLEEELNG